MDEHSTSSYVWLTEQLDLPIVGPGDRRRQDVHPGRVDRAERIGHQSRVGAVTWAGSRRR